MVYIPKRSVSHILIFENIEKREEKYDYNIVLS